MSNLMQPTSKICQRYETSLCVPHTTPSTMLTQLDYNLDTCRQNKIRVLPWNVGVPYFLWKRQWRKISTHNSLYMGSLIENKFFQALRVIETPFSSKVFVRYGLNLSNIYISFNLAQSVVGEAENLQLWSHPNLLV